jgi:hypothetical protein
MLTYEKSIFAQWSPNVHPDDLETAIELPPWSRPMMSSNRRIGLTVVKQDCENRHPSWLGEWNPENLIRTYGLYNTFATLGADSTLLRNYTWSRVWLSGVVASLDEIDLIETFRGTGMHFMPPFHLGDDPHRHLKGLILTYGSQWDYRTLSRRLPFSEIVLNRGREWDLDTLADNPDFVWDLLLSPQIKDIFPRSTGQWNWMRISGQAPVDFIEQHTDLPWVPEKVVGRSVVWAQRIVDKFAATASVASHSERENRKEFFDLIAEGHDLETLQSLGPNLTVDRLSLVLNPKIPRYLLLDDARRGQMSIPKEQQLRHRLQLTGRYTVNELISSMSLADIVTYYKYIRFHEIASLDLFPSLLRMVDVYRYWDLILKRSWTQLQLARVPDVRKSDLVRLFGKMPMIPFLRRPSQIADVTIHTVA